ncbi:MAG TPA: CBS domain-containing protein [Methanomicrobiales archaeon]|nr:CBS domain-containing protein [Methanomicrobiales archaeon]
MALSECCQKDVVTLSPYATAFDAATLMEERNVDIVVVTEENRPVGIVTDRDLVVRVLTKGREPGATLIHEIMTEEPLFLDERCGLYEAMKLGRDWSIRRIPVVDTEGELIGIITLDDIIQLLVEEISWVAHIIEKVSTPAASAQGS